MRRSAFALPLGAYHRGQHGAAFYDCAEAEHVGCRRVEHPCGRVEHVRVLRVGDPLRSPQFAAECAALRGRSQFSREHGRRRPGVAR